MPDTPVKAGASDLVRYPAPALENAVKINRDHFRLVHGEVATLLTSGIQPFAGKRGSASGLPGILRLTQNSTSRQKARPPSSRPDAV